MKDHDATHTSKDALLFSSLLFSGVIMNTLINWPFAQSPELLGKVDIRCMRLAGGTLRYFVDVYFMGYPPICWRNFATESEAITEKALILARAQQWRQS